MAGGGAAAIAIGCFASLCRDRLADHLLAFNAACPEIGIGVHEMGEAELLPAVADGRLALAIRPGEPLAGFAGCDLWGEQSVVALRPDHPFAARGSIEAARLAGEIMLVSRERSRAALHRFLVDRLFAHNPPATRIVADARRCQLLDRIAAGEGIALMCESQVDPAVARLAVRPIADAAAHFRVRAYWPHGAKPPALATLVTLLEASREG